MYAAYKWLCRIKHPTAMSAMHDAGGSATGSGEYVVMAAPDTRKEDLPNKASVVVVTTNRIDAAIGAFAEKQQLDDSATRVTTWKERMASIVPELRTAYIAATDGVPRPVTIRGSKLEQEYRNLHGLSASTSKQE